MSSHWPKYSGGLKKNLLKIRRSYQKTTDQFRFLDGQERFNVHNLKKGGSNASAHHQATCSELFCNGKCRLQTKARA